MGKYFTTIFGNQFFNAAIDQKQDDFMHLGAVTVVLMWCTYAASNQTLLLQK